MRKNNFFLRKLCPTNTQECAPTNMNFLQFCPIQHYNRKFFFGKNIQVFESSSRSLNSQINAKSYRFRIGHQLILAARSKLDEDVRFGNPIPVCREHTAFRASTLSNVYAAIPGETIFGPVIDDHVVQVTENHGREIEIPYPKKNSKKSISQMKESIRGRIAYLK